MNQGFKIFENAATREENALATKKFRSRDRKTDAGSRRKHNNKKKTEQKKQHCGHLVRSDNFRRYQVIRVVAHVSCDLDASRRSSKNVQNKCEARSKRRKFTKATTTRHQRSKHYVYACTGKATLWNSPRRTAHWQLTRHEKELRLYHATKETIAQRPRQRSSNTSTTGCFPRFASWRAAECATVRPFLFIFAAHIHTGAALPTHAPRMSGRRALFTCTDPNGSLSSLLLCVRPAHNKPSTCSPRGSSFNQQVSLFLRCRVSRRWCAVLVRKSFALSGCSFCSGWMLAVQVVIAFGGSYAGIQRPRMRCT